MLTALRLFTARLRALVGGAAQDREFARELESHLEMLTEDNVRRGMVPAEAARQARITLGAASSLQSRHREVRGFRLLDDFFQDLRFAARLMLLMLSIKPLTSWGCRLRLALPPAMHFVGS